MEPEEEIQNPVQDVMPDKLRDYLMAQKQNRPLYAANGAPPSGMSQFANSVKNAFGAPEAQAAKPDFKPQAQDPYSNFATSAATGHGKPKTFYSKSQNKTKIVYPDGREEILDGRVTK